ncbi:hypothetical protein NZK27_09795 [Synechococcus sp. FGCU-3]|nr:hypothetical protein [Synechococcus sp. FGCU3]
MLQIQAYLIHNADPARQAQRLAIAALLSELGISLEPICRQPPPSPFPRGWRGRWGVLRRELAKLGVDFAQRRLRAPGGGIDLLCRERWTEFKALGRCLRAPRERLQAAWRHSQVEAIVSDKHGRAWHQALAAGADLVLVFEDDVECVPASQRRLQAVLAAAPALLERKPCLYLDLAGGYPLEQVLPLAGGLPTEGLADLMLPGVHTNTACGYLVSRALLEAWLQALQLRPALAQLPIDHLINRASALQAPQAISGHWRQPVFRHGSFCGTVRSWQQ